MKGKQRFSKYFILSLLASLLIFILDGIYIFHKFNTFSNDKLFKLGKHINSELGTKVDNLISQLVDFMTFTESGVEVILEKEDYKKELDSYLLESTQILNKIFGRTVEGSLYGLFKGYYPEIYDFRLADFPDFVPSEFVPSEREWYIRALDGGGEIKIIGPYMDYGTKEMNLTLCKLLKDGESVLAFDFAIKDIHNFLNLLNTSKDYSTFIITESGIVVASKDIHKIFKDGITNSDVLRKFYDKKNKILVFDDDSIESFFLNGKRFFMFTKKISLGWYAVTIYDSLHFYMELIEVTINCILAFLIIFVLIFIFTHLNEKKRISMNTIEYRLAAMSDLFLMTYSIDIKNKTFEVIKCDEALGRFIGASHDYLKTAMLVCKRYINKDSMSRFIEFMDADTLNERTQDRRIISEEILVSAIGWCRFWYIKLDDENYMFALDNIDKEKKREHSLVKLSESDLMTGLLNHNCGLAKIKNCIEEKKYGMFCLFDVDTFKRFNDVYGHVVGDEVIISIAKVIRDSFRSTDIKMRLGGDEFIIYVQDIQGRKQASKIIENFFSKIDDIKITGHEDLKIYLSMGVAFYKNDSLLTYEEIYRSADKAAYESKKIKGNHFTFAEDI